MKVIGKTQDGYIAEINHSEIEKFLGLYYNKMERIEVGDTIDLGKGYDHHQDIKRAFEKTQDFIKAHDHIVKAIISGLDLTVINGGNDEIQKPKT